MVGLTTLKDLSYVYYCGQPDVVYDLKTSGYQIWQLNKNKRGKQFK